MTFTPFDITLLTIPWQLRKKELVPTVDGELYSEPKWDLLTGKVTAIARVGHMMCLVELKASA